MEIKEYKETKTPFEIYLQKEFLKDYYGTKDQVEDHFDGWLSNLDTQEVIDYANTFSRELLVLIK